MFLAAAIVIRPLPDSGWENIRIKRFWCSLLWLFGDYRAVSGLPFYRVAALYPRTSWDYVWCYYHGKRNYFSAVNSGLPTWRGHQLFLFSDGPCDGRRTVDRFEYGPLERVHCRILALFRCSGVRDCTFPDCDGPSGNSSCRWFEPNLGFAAMFDRAALPFALVTFFMTFSYAGVSAFLALYARELDLWRRPVFPAVLRDFPDDMPYLHREYL